MGANTSDVTCALSFLPFRHKAFSYLNHIGVAVLVELSVNPFPLAAQNLSCLHLRLHGAPGSHDGPVRGGSRAAREQGVGKEDLAMDEGVQQGHQDPATGCVSGCAVLCCAVGWGGVEEKVVHDGVFLWVLCCVGVGGILCRWLCCVVWRCGGEEVLVDGLFLGCFELRVEVLCVGTGGMRVLVCWGDFQKGRIIVGSSKYSFMVVVIDRSFLYTVNLKKRS